MEYAPLAFEGIQPFVRYVHAFTVDTDTVFVDVVPYDCRLIYIAGGQGVMRIQGRTYPARRGSLFLWPPGCAYSYLPLGGYPFSVLGVNFDYTMARSDVIVPVPPVKAREFQPSAALAPCRFSDIPLLNGPVALSDMFLTEGTLRQMEHEYLARRNHFSGKLTGMLLAQLCDVARAAAMLSGADRSGGDLIDAIIGYIHTHYRMPMDNGTLAREFSFHPAYIGRLIKRHTGMPLHRYLLRYRLSMALNLLQTTELPIACIAERTGFADSNYFSRCFRQYWGKSPGAFRPASAK